MQKHCANYTSDGALFGSFSCCVIKPIANDECYFNLYAYRHIDIPSTDVILGSAEQHPLLEKVVIRCWIYLASYSDFARLLLRTMQ